MASLPEISQSSAPGNGTAPGSAGMPRAVLHAEMSQQQNSLSGWWATVGDVQSLPIMGEFGIIEGFHFLFYTTEKNLPTAEKTNPNSVL